MTAPLRGTMSVASGDGLLIPSDTAAIARPGTDDADSVLTPRGFFPGLLGFRDAMSTDDSETIRTSARAFWVTAPGVGELRPAEVAAPGPSEVLVRTLYSGISRGTESLVFEGRVPPALHETMRGPNQEGELSLPVKYGYAAVGRVMDGRDPGRVVFCLHPHQTAFVVSEDAVHDIPGDVPPRRGVLAANMETALNAVWDARLSPGDRAVIVGAGAVGCLTARLAARVPGCEVTLVDIDERREPVAEALGVTFASPDLARGGADVVFHSSASSEGLQRSIDLAGPDATVVETSWFGDREVTLALGGNFHPGRVRIVASQVGTLPPHQPPRRWTYRRRMSVALRLLADDALDVLLTGESSFDDLPDTMRELASPAGPVLCHRICY